VRILKDPPGENGRETSEVQEHDAEEDYEDGEERENHDPVDNPSSLDEEDRAKSVSGRTRRMAVLQVLWCLMSPTSSRMLTGSVLR
jgi:hypothetical protein